MMAVVRTFSVIGKTGARGGARAGGNVGKVGSNMISPLSMLGSMGSMIAKSGAMIIPAVIGVVVMVLFK